MSIALELFLQAKRGVRAVTPYNPFAAMPLDAASAFARLFAGATQWFEPNNPQIIPAEQPIDEVAELRREVEDLKQSLKKPR
jgi:hypothetical protein